MVPELLLGPLGDGGVLGTVLCIQGTLASAWDVLPCQA